VVDQFDEWLDSGLTFPYRGVEYRVEPPSALTVLTLHRTRTDGHLNDGVERDAVQRILGATWDAMVADGVPATAVLHIGRTALTHYLDSAESARLTWKFESTPEKPAAEKRDGPSIKGVDPDDSVDPPGTINEYDPGGGPYIPDMGIRVWAYPMEYAPAFQKRPDTDAPTWTELFEVWDAVDIDFQTLLRIDLAPTWLESVPWQRFSVRLAVILGDQSSLTRRLLTARKAVNGGNSVR